MSHFDEEESDFSTDDSEFSDDSDPPWQDEIEEDGELFYVEEDRTNDLDTLHNGTEARNGIEQAPAVINGQNTGNANSRQKRAGASARLPSRSSASNVTTRAETESISKKDTTPIKTVFVAVDPPSSYDIVSSSLLKEMLGIISLQTNDISYRFNKFISADSLIVSAMMPDGPAFSSEAIEIGDVLLAINNVAVYRSNIEQVLQRIPHRMELRLTIHCADRSVTRASIVTETHDENQQSVQVSLEMLKISNTDNTGDKLDPFQAVFYLTLNVDSETAKGEEDIIYMYPKDSLGVRKLKSTRGIFTTLADVATDAFKSEVKSSVVFINNELVHCAYCRNGSEVLVICVPGSRNLLPSLHNTMSRIVRLLKVTHGSLTKAFESSNWIRLNHLFHLVFSMMSRSGDSVADAAYTGIESPVFGVKTLTLDDQIVTDIDSSLSEFEAADFDDGVWNVSLFRSRGSTRRLFSILGTCLFYKGHMLASHIPDEDLKDMLTLCQSYCLFNLSNVGRILIWREVFPTRKDTASKNTPFKETSGRYFYLFIGLRHCLLCVLLESGGCSLSVEAKPRPPLLYINHATAVILHLEKVGTLTKVDTHLSRPEVPALLRADTLTKKTSFFGGSSEKPAGSNQPAAGQGSIKFPFLSPSKRNAPQNTDSPEYQESTDSLKAASAISASGEKLARLTVGVNNTLFYFVRFDLFSGTLLTHSERPYIGAGGTLQTSILRNFQHTILLLHDRLLSSRKRAHIQEALKHPLSNCSKNPGQTVYEEGAMFQFSGFDSRSSQSGRKGGAQLQFWVVGRCMAKPRLKEFFVCYHDSVRQDMSELAFRMGFGIAA